MDVGMRLKKIRTEKKITSVALAKKCNLSQSTISKLENNNRTADIPTISIICTALGLTLDEFFNEKKFLNEDDIELLTYFRKLSNKDKWRLLERAAVMVEESNKSKDII